MTDSPTAKVMPESEVSLRLAMHLIASGQAQEDVSVALDGAQVRIGDQHHFDVVAFMAGHGWHQVAKGDRWQGRYERPETTLAIAIHSQSGMGDVTTILSDNRPLVVEAKKGSLKPSKTSAEYKLMREALGQLLTIEAVPTNAVLAIAVPHGERFVKLAERWRQAPLIVRTAIQTLTVDPDGGMHGQL